MMAARDSGSISEDAGSIITETVLPQASSTAHSATPSITSTCAPEPETPTFDIEHMPVKNDPRAWSSLRKNLTLILISTAAMIAALASNIQNPAVVEMEEDLPATPSQFSLSISIFILTQGLFPLIWTAISEVKGRKIVYVSSLAIFTIGSITVATSKNIQAVIGFRCLQAAGSSAVISLGAATLADIYETSERGKKLGIYYIAPLLGPAIGPVFGGIFTDVWGWRSIFWFLTILGGVTLASFFLIFQDTFRLERSLIYQRVLKEHIQAAKLQSSVNGMCTPSAPSFDIGSESEKIDKTNIDIEKTAGKVQVQVSAVQAEVNKETTDSDIPPVKLSLKHVNFIGPLIQVLRRKNNALILLSSGLLFAYSFVVVYSVSRTLSSNYNLSALKIGFVTISYGGGSVFGSILGGRYSDYQLAKMKAANGGQGYAEMRLSSTIPGMILLPPSIIAFGWVCERHLPIVAICIFLFLGGFFCIWTYSSSLAYTVDSNVGRSSTAVAANSAIRGIFAFISVEVTVPLQDKLGDGWMFVVWAGVVTIGLICILLLIWRGRDWRIEAETREADDTKRADDARNTANTPTTLSATTSRSNL